MTSRPVLTLYSRGYCHLCDDMRQALEALRGPDGAYPDGFDLCVVDVDTDALLVARYDELVPVLVAGTAGATQADGTMRELCHYWLDLPAVRAYLMEFR